MTRHYIRFGNWPTDERSRVGERIRLFGGGLYQGGDYEAGVSVYSAFWDAHKQRWSIPTLGINTYLPTLDELFHGSSPVFLVTGDEIGIGTDGEPLLINLQLIQQIERSQIYNDYITSEDVILDLDPPPTTANNIEYLFKQPGYPLQRFFGCLTTEKIQELVGGYFDEISLSNNLVMLVLDPETPEQLRQSLLNVHISGIGDIYGSLIVTARASSEEILAGRKALSWPWFDLEKDLEDQPYEIPGEDYRSLTKKEEAFILAIYNLPH